MEDWLEIKFSRMHYTVTIENMNIAIKLIICLLTKLYIKSCVWRKMSPREISGWWIRRCGLAGGNLLMG